MNDWTFYLDDFVVSPTYIGPRGCSVDGDCDDSNVCTTDTCPAGECVFTNNTDACDDGLYCTTGEACSGGVCTGGSARNCADADACTTDSCNEATDACDHTGSCSALIPEPKGVYLLGGLGTTTTIGNLVDSWISGYAGRVSWTTLDTGTVQDDHAVYVWTYIDAVVNGAETYGKPFTLCVHTIVPPPWIVAHAGETYTPRISGDEYTTPVPWDSTSLGYQEAFALELANHVTGAYGALKDNPLFMGIRTSLIGLKGLDEDEGDEMTALGTYNRADFWVGVKRSMHAWADAFPTKAIYVEMAPFSDATESPQLDDWLIDQYTAEFDGSPYQQIGVFMESQKGYTPAPTGGAGVNLLHAISHGSYVLFQACGSWLARSPCGAVWPADDYWPENGFNLGYGAYGCTYYEYYNSDLTNAPWQTMLQQWHDFFAGAGAISRPGPASLSAGTSGSTSMQ